MRHGKLFVGLVLAAALALPAAAANGAATKSCGDYSTSVSGAKLTVRNVTATGIACAPAKRLVKQCITMVGPSAAWKPSQKGNRVTLKNGSRRVAFTLTRNAGDCVGS
jgi:hypothetical protein